MSRLIIILAAIFVILAGGLFLLAGRNGEKPLAHVEKVVPLASLRK